MKRIIKLTESDLHNIIKNTAKRALAEMYEEGSENPALIASQTIDDYNAQEIAENEGYNSNDEAAAAWFREVVSDADFEENTMPKYNKYITDIPELNASMYYDWYAEYYFVVKNDVPSQAGMAYESVVRRAVKESLNRLIETDCAGVMQTGCGNAPKGTNPEAGQYTTAYGADEETKDRHPGFSVDGKAKWNKGGNTSVMRRPMYNPKSGKKK